MRTESNLLTAQHTETPPNHGALDNPLSDMDWANFEMGFWHPFGQHGREAPSDIIDRKRSETEKNGWTLWSFQYRTPETLANWCRALSSARGPVLVFCSKGSSAVDPDRPGALAKTSDCTLYRWPDSREWRPVPGLIRVPHPFAPSKRVASAFVVRRVHPIGQFERPQVEWLSQNKWRADALPTRPEYLIRRGGKIGMRDVSVVLELQPPYLAIVTL